MWKWFIKISWTKLFVSMIFFYILMWSDAQDGRIVKMDYSISCQAYILFNEDYNFGLSENVF